MIFLTIFSLTKLLIQIEKPIGKIKTPIHFSRAPIIRIIRKPTKLSNPQ
jgi:hypothetical protein